MNHYIAANANANADTWHWQKDYSPIIGDNFRVLIQSAMA